MMLVDWLLTILIIFGVIQMFMIFYILWGISNDIFKCNSRIYDLRVESLYKEINKLKIENETLNKCLQKD